LQEEQGSAIGPQVAKRKYIPVILHRGADGTVQRQPLYPPRPRPA
jgi:hypothetical protein